MDILIILLALFLLMFAAYRGLSVILFAPLCAMLAVLFTSPALVPVLFSGVFMEKLAGFIKLYFPVFLLGAIFGKLIEISGFARAIAHAIVGFFGQARAMLAIVMVGAVLTYGGVSLFVVAFAVFPFAKELFKLSNIPKRLIPATIALGAFTFTMDALPGSPQIQNIIPTTFFNTTTWAAPWLGLIGSIVVFSLGMIYLQWRRKKAAANGEGYARNEAHPTVAANMPAGPGEGHLPAFSQAILPLILVAVCNKLFTVMILHYYGDPFEPSGTAINDVPVMDISKMAAVWSVTAALIVGCIAILIMSSKKISVGFNSGIQTAIGGALLAIFNTASEYGFGSIIALLPGFKQVNKSLGQAISDPLVNEAVTITTLSGITGSASGGMSIALAAMSETYRQQASLYGIPPEVLHRVAAMASGGMDTLPHNGAVITLLAVTGLTHRQSYPDIFVMTLIKTFAVFFIIAVYYLTGLV